MKKRVIRLSENDINRIVKRVISEGAPSSTMVVRPRVNTGGDDTVAYISNGAKRNVSDAVKALTDLVLNQTFKFGKETVVVNKASSNRVIPEANVSVDTRNSDGKLGIFIELLVEMDIVDELEFGNTYLMVKCGYWFGENIETEITMGEFDIKAYSGLINKINSQILPLVEKGIKQGEADINAKIVD